MTRDETTAPSMNRRGFLLAGLAGAVTLTVGGTTGLIVGARPAAGAPLKVLDVTGDYSIVDARTGAQVTVTVRNGIRRIRANGLPNHVTGAFPNAHNPNTISAQAYDVSLPARPTRNPSSTAYALPQQFGVAVNGVPFDPFAAEWWGGQRNGEWQFEAMGGGVDLGLDSSNAHVQPTGAYHYHGIPGGLVATLPTSRHSPLVGWAGDGFPIYLNRGYRKPMNAGSGLTTLTSSYVLKSGTRPSGPGGAYDGTYVQDWQYSATTGSLDEANGRFAVTPEYPRGTYYYVLPRTSPRSLAASSARWPRRSRTTAPGRAARRRGPPSLRRRAGRSGVADGRGAARHCPVGASLGHHRPG